jgi:hypothetical protein
VDFTHSETVGWDYYLPPKVHLFGHLKVSLQEVTITGGLAMKAQFHTITFVQLV